jgi:hypothetical protein
MCNKILAAVTAIIALILAILAVSLQPEQLRSVILVSRFFEVMIPVLAVGALIRYLTYCPNAGIYNTILAGCFLFIAVILGILALVLSPANINFVIIVSRFFEVMLPIFAVGALIKYLTCCKKEECKTK